MNNKHIEGNVNEVKGKIKEDVGHFAGDKSLAGEGVLDQIKGKAQQLAGDVKDAVKEGVDHLLSRDKH